MGFSFILLAAGDGERFKSKIPKQYLKIAGKTLVDISINKIKQFNQIKRIVFVYNKKHTKYLKENNLKGVKLILGGNSRSESTYKALIYLKKQKNFKHVLIHDVARPNFSKQLLKNILVNSKKNKTVIPILKIQDALKERKKKNIILNIKKKNFFLTQTPQCFNGSEIYKLHKEKKERYVDDDFSLLNNISKVKFINGEKRNFKITLQDDFNLLKDLYKSNLRVGLGFDVHRLTKGRKLYLGGVKIPSKLGTLGHSDGDPILHAIIDAILGACGMGDIGDKFSNKSKKYENISSSILIQKILSELKNKNYFINNIDINIIAEYPKLKKYKKDITHKIANLCDVSTDRINIKAKTTEKLGVIGNEKAIASEVIVSVIKYD